MKAGAFSAESYELESETLPDYNSADERSEANSPEEADHGCRLAFLLCREASEHVLVYRSSGTFLQPLPCLNTDTGYAKQMFR